MLRRSSGRWRWSAMRLTGCGRRGFDGYGQLRELRVRHIGDFWKTLSRQPPAGPRARIGAPDTHPDARPGPHISAGLPEVCILPLDSPTSTPPTSTLRLPNPHGEP
jgi:hypothetical protein